MNINNDSQPILFHSTYPHDEFGDINNEESSGINIKEINKSSNESDEISYSSTINPQTPSITKNDDLGLDFNHFSPSPQDSPLLNESNNDQYLSNHFFNDEKLEPNIDGDNLFNLSPDQQQAFRELELRRQQAEYEDDYDFGLNYDQVPEYDVREKLQTLNAQLASEPLPPDPEHRNSKVAFRNDIVSGVAPAEYYEQSESEPEDTSYNTETTGQSPAEVGSEITYSSPVLSSGNSHPRSMQTSELMVANEEITKIEEIDLRTEDKDQSTDPSVENKNVELDDDVKVNDEMIVSRGGKFELLGTDDIMDRSNRITEIDDDKSSNEGEIIHTKSRPISARASKTTFKNHSLNIDSGSSAKSDMNSRSSSLLQKQNERSKLQIPRVDKEALRRQQERKKKEEEENLKREEEEQKMRKEMNIKSFNAWLLTKQKSKKEEDERKKKEEEEEKEKKEKLQEERRAIAEEKERELTKKWENDKKKEDKLRQYRLKEMEESMIIHSKEECRQAYKSWLKKKHKDHQNKVKEERQRARITRLAMRQCRKSQDLAQAIQQSSSFRYLDFCGYT